MIKFAAILLMCASAYAAKYNCSAKSALLILKRPTYEFSVKLLDRVAQDNDNHFVFSPISTYLQLLALAEGANGRTLREIRNVTRHHQNRCFRRKWRWILNRLDAELAIESKRRSLIVLDRLMAIKKPFIREIERLKSMDVMLLDFYNSALSAERANREISDATNGVIKEVFTPNDFNPKIHPGILMADTSYYKSDWKIPFDPVYTSSEPFYSRTGKEAGEVLMMTRIDYFNYAEIPVINAKVLELPCGSDDRVSMLVFLPLRNNDDVFYLMQKVRLMSIFNAFKKNKPKLVHVKIPKFKITSDIDNIPELVYDMGVKSVFHPNLANLKGITDFKLYASLMTQIADIEITEKGVQTAVAGFLVSDKNSIEFFANKPFAYMLVDKKTEIILFGGMYSIPLGMNDLSLSNET
ncbi:serine protease inhibitor 77Ba-like [Ostrinia furnacalis]|uniref:serine protease inhibitor 77Ba-like n=1 Tax=Ostrinia furnacalis TaxID=93504 RepID=UPI00103D075C|nr:serine protease inhibitor 77Ba-like [Ostrinia furnacalis]